MKAQKSFLAAIFHSALKKHPKGSLVPDQVVKFFLEQSCSHCLHGKYLVSDTIATWLKSECDFTNLEVEKFLTNVRAKVLEEIGVEILPPGSSVPQEAVISPKEKEVVLEPAYDAEDWGTEWDGNPIEEEQEHKKNEGKEISVDEEPGSVSKNGPMPENPSLEKGLPPVPISVEKAMSILEKIALEEDIDQDFAQIVEESEILGEFEKSLFRSDKADFYQLEYLKKALAYTFLLEYDYAYYTGKRKIQNVTLKEAINQSKILLERIKNMRETLSKLAQSSSQEGQYGEAGALNTLLEKLRKSESKLDEVVSTLSSTSSKQEEYITPKSVSASIDISKNRVPKQKHTIIDKNNTNSGKEKIKIALAFLFMISVVVGVSLFLNKLFSKKTTLIVYNPSEFSSLIQLKEARRQGTAFIGIVSSNYWNNLSKEEKKNKTEKLLHTVKREDVHGILLMTSDNTLVAQSYGDEIKIYK